MTGRRIVFTTWGSFGDTHPYMALALELQRRGHHPVFATSEIYREKVEAAGLEFFPVQPDLPSPESEEAGEMIRRLSDTFDGPRYLFREILMPHLRDTYEDTLASVEANGGADLIVSHQVPLTAGIVAEKTKTPRVSCVLFPIAFASVYDPPTPPQFPAIREVVALHPLIGSVLMSIGKWVMKSWVDEIHELRSELGLPPIANPIFEGQHSATRVLALFSPTFAQKQPDFPPQTVITGFPFYDRSDARGDFTPEIESFIKGGEPPIVFTLGSSLIWLAGDFYKIAIEACRTMGRRALLLTGDKRSLPTGELPETIAAFDYAPHNLVMPLASCVVHQGGIGTTAQALRSGRPMLVVPHGQDQPDNARRCVKLGVGRSIPAAKLTVQKLIDELTQIINNPSFAEQAKIVGQKIRSEDGTKTACDEIERVLSTNG